MFTIHHERLDRFGQMGDPIPFTVGVVSYPSARRTPANFAVIGRARARSVALGIRSPPSRSTHRAPRAAIFLCREPKKAQGHSWTLG